MSCLVFFNWHLNRRLYIMPSHYNCLTNVVYFLANYIISGTLAYVFNQDVLPNSQWRECWKNKVLKTINFISCLLFLHLPSLYPCPVFHGLKNYFLSYNHWPNFLLLYHFLLFKEEKNRCSVRRDAIICYGTNLMEQWQPFSMQNPLST